MARSRVRRIPKQERSKKRFEAILDAAAEEFGRAGFEATTIDAVAERAETSVGSVYQFFPDKLALFQALAERALARSRALFDAVITPEALEMPWADLVDVAVDAFSALLADPGFRALNLNHQLYGVFAEADAGLHDEFIARIEALIATHGVPLPRRRRRLIATMVVQLLSVLLFLAVREEKAFGRELIAETKAVLRRYLTPYMRG